MTHQPSKEELLRERCRRRRCATALPALSGSIAAILTEGKTIKEMENIAVFLSALANDIFLIASVTARTDVIIPEEIL